MIRQINQDNGLEVRQVLAIYNRAIRRTTDNYTEQEVTFHEMTRRIKDKQVQGIPFFVCITAGEVTGFATYGAFRAPSAYRFTVEHSIYVHPTHRNKGIASRLMQELIDAATENGMRAMIGVIDSQNSGSIHLHEKMGFEFKGKLEKVGYKFGNWLDVVLFERHL
ncbi:GNAT family N-acetyltransferase [Vagococcus acidifermentans]|uniref:N-acetyltransferase domain-containing protein n=1 Tax=Vagococcus acidifermentans TaxID=564710 RepID=A0A430AZ04_9ENTE|nr:GNAT family N-acetyltransferase [Vagococcus acidifermentans]RSU13265.1 hypothetical protein CBF27_03525 [Vagococcus acidifermentans]